MNRTYIVAVAAAVLLVASAAAAEVQTREIEYKEGEAVLQGLIAWDDAAKGLRPGVLVVHGADKSVSNCLDAQACCAAS